MNDGRGAKVGATWVLGAVFAVAASTTPYSLISASSRTRGASPAGKSAEAGEPYNQWPWEVGDRREGGGWARSSEEAG